MQHILLMMFLLALPFGGMESPVVSECTVAGTGDSVTVSFGLKIAKGWHVYSLGLPDGGPSGTSLSLDSVHGLELCGGLEFDGNEKGGYDSLFGMEVRYFEDSVTFRQTFRAADEPWNVTGYLSYSACNDESCIPPQEIEFSFSSDSGAGGNAPETSVSAGNDGIDAVPGFDRVTWAPVGNMSDSAQGNGRGLLGLIITSFLGGLLALVTPCVWPVIPMTVSFFLKRAENSRLAVRDALLYGVSIVVVYVSLGLLVTLLFGASALNSLSTNAVVNIVFFVMLVVFALSFFGLFEITLPSSWSTSLTRKSRSAGGFAGIFFMALTLAVVSFSCTGPIIGFLLVDAASTDNLITPTVGMFFFSLAMAIPFTLFAMFPHWLGSIPKSGGWMEKVKVTLGFVELAFSLKFLSVADMAYGWGILPRPLFLLLWILMALILGLYLLGIIKIGGGSDGKRSAVSVAFGTVSLLFALWMIPGLLGAPLKAISAFTPPMSTQRVRSDGTLQVKPDFVDYSAALERSDLSGRPVLVDFTGYGCVNCRKMEAAVWTDCDVAGMIRDSFVLVSLFVDDKTPLDSTITVVENGKRVRIRTVGDKWSLLQRYKFGANAQPYYVVVDGKGRLLAGPYTFDDNPARFKAFLESALRN